MTNFKIYENMSDEEYSALEGARSTVLTTIYNKTPAHAFYEMNNPKDKKCFRIGRAFHDYILRPDVFAKKWGIFSENYNGTTKDGKAEKAELLAKYGDDNLIKFDELQDIKGMFESYMSNKYIRHILENITATELSIQYTDPETGILCKCRLDLVSKLPSGKPIIADLKSTLDASLNGFAKTIKLRGYHFSADHYLVGAKMAGILQDNSFIHLLAEKQPPYLCSWQVIDDGSLDRGHEERRSALLQYDRAMKTGKWTGYQEELITVALDHWYLQQDINEDETLTDEG